MNLAQLSPLLKKESDMREHLVLTILLQVKSMYEEFIREEKIWNAPKMDETILEYNFLNGHVDTRLLRDDNLADTFFDLINTYKNYYKIYLGKTS